MPHNLDFIELNFTDGRFILARSTINSYPNSMLAEELASQDAESIILNIERESRQFKLIRQMMVYKERTRTRDILAADLTELVEDLKYYRLDELLEYIKQDSRVEPSTANIRYVFNGAGCRGRVNRPTIYIHTSIDIHAQGWFKKFNFNKYDYLIRRSTTSGYLEMRFLLPTKSLSVIYYRKANADEIENEKIFYAFLSAVERYDIKKGIIIGKEYYHRLRIIEQ